MRLGPSGEPIDTKGKRSVSDQSYREHWCGQECRQVVGERAGTRHAHTGCERHERARCRPGRHVVNECDRCELVLGADVPHKNVAGNGCSARNRRTGKSERLGAYCARSCNAKAREEEHKPLRLGL